MRRREILAGLAWLGMGAGVRAQSAAMPVVGFLRSTPSADLEHLVVAFREGLKERGFAAGENVTVEYRFADDHLDRVPSLTRDLIGRGAAAIVGDSIAIIAAKTTGTSVPLIFATGGDPVRTGLVGTLNHPGGNVTGVTFFGGELGPKRLELLRQLSPKAAPIAVLVIPDNPTGEAERREVEEAARSIGQELIIAPVASEPELKAAFAGMAERGAGAVLVGAGTFLSGRRELIVALAAQHALPAVYSQREAALAGGLMSYGTSVRDAYRQTGVYAARILKGEKPGDLPVVQNAKFEFVINARTAKTLGLALPPALLALADEVIE